MVNLLTVNKRIIAGSPEPLFNVFKNRNRNIGVNNFEAELLFQQKYYFSHSVWRNNFYTQQQFID